MIPAALMTDSITMRAREAVSSYGISYGIEKEVTCYVERASRRIRDNKGLELIASLLVITAPDVAIEVGDQALYGGEWYTCIDVRRCRFPGQQIDHHVEAYFGAK